MADKVYQPAGDAQEEQFASAPNPIGLYRNIYNGTEVGILDPIQGDAVVRNGFELVEEGREAAMKTQEDMDKSTAKFLKKRDSNPDDEIALLQAKLDAANERIATSQASEQNPGNTELIRATSDQSDTAQEQSQLVPERNIKAPVTAPTSPEAPKGDDLKAAQAAKKEADQPTHTAEQDMKAAGMLSDDGKKNDSDGSDNSDGRGVNKDATLKPGATASEQLSDVIPGADPEPKGAEKQATPAPDNDGNRSEALAKQNEDKENK